MIVLALFLSTYLLVMALGAQSLLVNNGRYLGAFLNSFVIGSGNLILYKLAPNASGMEIAAFLAGGPFGILEALKETILSKFRINEVKQDDVLVTNLRHYQKLNETHQALSRVLEGLESGISGDFLAMDIRQALYYLGEITGEITSDDLLTNIFAKFCIGK